MASLRDTVKDYQDELRDGIAWVAFWKQGRSWNAEYFHLDMDDTLYPEDRSRLEEIKSTDPAAVILNGYYCGHLGGDMSLDELTAGVRYHYENSMNDIDAFIGAHDDRLPPEVIEEARAAAHEAGLPFSEKPYRDGADFNPYVFDGSMSIEDFELMHRMIEKERSEQMAEPILSGYLSNLGKYTEGRPAGEWVTFPTTAEHLKEVFDRIGIDFKHYEEWHFTEFQSTIPGLTEHLSEYSHPDELNYLGKLLEMQFDDDREKFIAAIEYGDHADSLQDIINLAQNLDCYWIYPSVHNEEEYGHYLVDELEEPELSDEVKRYFMYEEYGRDASINDDGMFTEKGYIYNNRNTFTEWYDGRDVPQEYRVTPQPPQPERPDPEKEDFDAAAMQPALAAEPRPVIPIIPTADTSDGKLKEIAAHLERGITELFDSERYADYLRVMSKFPTYSLRNTVLIAMQAPDATHVMGFNAWKDPLINRHVKADEKGIRIIAPTEKTIRKRVEKLDPDTQQPIIGTDGKPVTEVQEIKIPKFIVVSVFDVAQTEGKELPTLAAELTGNVEQYPDFFAALEKTSPFAVGFDELTGSIKGRCNYEERKIIINEGMSELQNIKTAIHEIAHATLHDTAIDAPERPDRRTREVQAESIAFTVCQHYGLDTSDYSFGYVAGWSSGRELAELKSSLEIIKSTAAKLIEAIDGHFAEIQKEQAKGQAQAQPEAVTEPPETPAPEQPEAAPQKQADTAQETRSEAPQETATAQETQQAAAPYYSINETAARHAKDMSSFYDYKPGSATAEYRSYIDEAVQIAERQKKRVDPMYHEKIDSLLDTYARKLAANMNKGYEIAGRVPSILIAGGSNFPTRKKEKQNAATDRNMQEYRDIQGLLDKIRSTGMGGISADDPQAVEKLQKKLAGLEKSQETMKAVNAYYRKHKTLDGCPHLPPEQLEKLKADMSSQWHLGDKPFASWALSNNNAEIRRVKDRIKSLSQTKEIGFVGWEFEGGRVEANTEANRLQIFFDGKPDEATRTELKSNGFRWSPKAEAWQRQLTNNAYYAADYVKSIQPLTGEKPTDLLRAHIRSQKEAAQAQPPQEYIYQVHANPRSDSRENLSILQAYVPQEDGKAQIGDVLYIGTPEKCRELMGQLNAGELTQAEVKELYAKAQETAKTAGQGKDTFSIYQIKGGDETRDFRFEPYDRLQAAGNVVDRANYELVYSAPLAPETSLEDIYTRFNIDHPKDFKGHSLSVSDVVVLHQNGQDAAHFVDSVGFRQVPEFLQEQKQLTPDDLETGETIKTPRGTFHVTAMSREQIETAGYGFHHQSDDGKYLIMGNGTRAFAVAAEQPEKENPLKYVEDTVEQNDNSFDGIINNTPTVDELEAKVKAGETISLVDLANAVKADRERGKEAKPEKKPSIRAQLRADKEKAQKKNAKQKSQDLERS